MVYGGDCKDNGLDGKKRRLRTVFKFPLTHLLSGFEGVFQRRKKEKNVCGGEGRRGG